MLPTPGSSGPGVGEGGRGLGGESLRLPPTPGTPPSPVRGLIHPGLPLATPQAASPLTLALGARESGVKEPGSLAVWGMGGGGQSQGQGHGENFHSLPAAPGDLRAV